MLFILHLLLLASCKKKAKTKESLSIVIPIIRKKFNIDQYDVGLKKLDSLFDYHKPKSKEKEKLVIENKSEFKQIAPIIIKEFGLENNKKVNEKRLVRCISRNMQLFSYACHVMKREHPTVFQRIKTKYLQSIIVTPQFPDFEFDK